MHPVALIVVAQLFGTSLWFSVNGVAAELSGAWQLTTADLGTLTNAVQLGFILGTLLFALTGLADRFAASRIFAVCALAGAGFNAAFALLAEGLASGLPLRFCVGLALAGVYPLGMKLVVTWVPERAGAALAWLVGMLTLGTALPHGIQFAGTGLPWQGTLLIASGLAVLAALLIAFLGDGPQLKRRATPPTFRLGRVLHAFTLPAFRASALGYFGHCWELYAFWSLVPALLVLQGNLPAGSPLLAGVSFAVIGIGALGCVLGGRLSHRLGSPTVAATALAISGTCCALFPFLGALPGEVSIALMFLWGLTVIADSPHFSALSAKACPPDQVGSALAFQNAIGFTITMISIQWGNALVGEWGSAIAWLLLPGPVLGLIGFSPLWRSGRHAPRRST